MYEFYTTDDLEKEFIEIQNNRRIKNKVLASSFYTKEVKEALNYIDEEEEKDNYNYNSYPFFSLDMIKEKLASDLEVYEVIYINIDVIIDNREWDIIFNSLYEYYGINNNLECYFDCVRLNRLAISEAIIDNKELTAYYYIKNIRLLSFLNKRDKRSLRNEISEKIDDYKIIDFNKYKIKKNTKIRNVNLT